MMTILCLLGLLLVINVMVTGNRKLDKSLLMQKNVIDMHVHIAGIGAGNSGCYVSPEMRKNWRYRTYLKAFEVSEKELLACGDALVFQRVAEKLNESRAVKAAVILALDGVVDANGELDLARTEAYIPNEFVARETAKFANLFYGASVNPYRHDALQRLDKVAAEGAVLIKWLPAIQHIDPADESLIPFYLRLKSLGLILLTHAGNERSFTTASSHWGDPERLRLPLSLGVRVIAAHAATTGKSEGEDNLVRLLRMFPKYPNLYADISSLTQANKLFYLSRLLKHDVHDRLIYGTDFPLINTPLVSPWYYPFQLSLRQMIQISRLKNPWDRDLLLKSALSVPAEVFVSWENIIGKSAGD